MIKALDKAERKQLSKAGAFVWRTARQSIRKRKRIATPGSPPSGHTGRYKKSILFGYDFNASAVVIGPSAAFGGSDVPSYLEDKFPHMFPALEKESPKFPSLFRNSVRS